MTTITITITISTNIIAITLSHVVTLLKRPFIRAEKHIGQFDIRNS